MDDSCAVCAEPLEWVAYGACLHREVCSTCVVRLRFILNDKRCCICKSDCPTIFVTKAMGDYTRVVTDFSGFPPGATEGQNGSYWYHEDTQGYFEDTDHYKMIKAMCRLSCSVCDRAGPDEAGAGVGPARRRNRFRSIDQLKGHLFHQHKLNMCDLCLEGRKVFICEQKLYTRTQLQQHRRSGDPEVDGIEEERSGFMGHPMCDFCKSHFYGDNELYMHMSTEHYTCHICQRQHPGQYDYFRNYDDLEMHFRQEHILCENEECLAKKFVVFQNEQELKRHNALEHGGNMSRAQRNAALQIPTSFRYRRSEQEQRRGGRFSGGRGRNFRRDTPNDFSTPIHRDNDDSVAASLESVSLTSSQREQVLEQSSFPPLSDPRDGPDLRPGSTTDPPDNQDSSVSRYALALNQNSRSTNALREESFPPLPGVSNRVQPGPNHAPHQGLQSLARDTLAARLQQRSKGAVKVIHPRSRQPDPPLPSLCIRDHNRSIPGLGPAPVPPNSAWSNSTSTSTGSSSYKLKQSAPMPNLNQAGPSVNPSAGVSSSIPNGVLVPTVVPDAVKNANSSLVGRIRECLGNDEERYSLFKSISAEYRQGDIGTVEYLSYVEQFGLSSLVPELARLLPDKQKQKELTEAYYSNLRLKNLREASANGSGNSGRNNGSSSKSSKKGKGKDAVTDNFLETVKKLQADQRSAQEEEKVEVLSKDGYRISTKGKTAGESSNSSNVVDDGTGTKQQRAKKTSKFIRVRLGDGSAAALLDRGRTDTSPERPDRGTEGGVPVRGVWKNGGGQRLAKDLFK